MKKKIVIISVFATLLMLSMPLLSNVSAINIEKKVDLSFMNENQKEKIKRLMEKILNNPDVLPCGITNIAYIILGILTWPIAICIGLACLLEGNVETAIRLFLWPITILSFVSPWLP